MKTWFGLILICGMAFVAGGCGTCSKDEVILYPDGGVPEGDCADPCALHCKAPVSKCGRTTTDAGVPALTCRCSTLCL